MASKDLEWQTNIHGVEQHEARGNKKVVGLLWEDLRVGSWFTSTNYKQFFDYHV
jgi:hypothetical protein